MYGNWLKSVFLPLTLSVLGRQRFLWYKLLQIKFGERAMRAKIYALVLFVFLLGILLGQHGSQPSEDKRASAPLSAHFAMNVVVSGVPFWTDTRETWAKIAMAIPGVTTEFAGPLNTDSQKQIEEIESLITRKVDCIVIAPTDSGALTGVIDRAVAQGIPVITMLNDSPTSKRLAYITSPRETASKKMVSQIASMRGELAGKAAILLSQAGNEEQEGRAAGFKSYIADHPSLTLVGVIEDNFDETKGAEGMAALLTRNPDLKFVFGCNSRSAVGAVSALKELHKIPGEVLVSGWDYDDDVLTLIEQSWVVGSVAQQSSFITQLAFDILLAHRLQFLYPQSLPLQTYGIRPLPEVIEVPVNLVTKENVAAYRRMKSPVK